VVMAELIKPTTHWPLVLAILVALAVTAAIGALHGTLITRLGLPSFVVTLAGLLGWQGVMLLILGQGGVVPINNNVINDLTSGQLTVAASWILMGILVAAFGLRAWLRDSRRRASGLVAPPPSVTALRIAAVLVAGVVVVLSASRLRSVATSIDGGTLVLYAVAAAVIGGTSLFGGRGKPSHAVLGGLVIAAIDNGMGLQGYSAYVRYIVTALVLLAAV